MNQGSQGVPDAERLYARVSWRLIPFLFVCYVCAYLDRVNVGYAKLQMLDELGWSEVVYGFGAGVFFVGYFFFEVPSNLLMLRIGARRTIARIMILWGLISAAMMFVTTPLMFYVFRFLLGVAEAGFFPGVIFYLTLWFPAKRRGRIVALFATAVAISIVIGGPLSGFVMSAFDGANGWSGWQWLFLIEGLPSVVMGFVAFRYLDDGIADASWLKPEEKKFLSQQLNDDPEPETAHRIVDAFRMPKVWLLAAIYFSLVMGLYGLNFWLPTIMRELGYESLVRIGLISAIPFACAAVCMVLVGHSADRHDERRWHVIVPATIGAMGLVASVLLSASPVMAIVALSVAACGIFSAIPQAWGLATRFVTGGAAAAGIAVINSVGNLSGLVAPWAIGWIKQGTGTTAAGMYLLAAFLLLGALLVYCVKLNRISPARPTE